MQKKAKTFCTVTNVLNRRDKRSIDTHLHIHRAISNRLAINKSISIKLNFKVSILFVTNQFIIARKQRPVVTLTKYHIIFGVNHTFPSI